jgi:hypothetical protein
MNKWRNIVDVATFRLSAVYELNIVKPLFSKKAVGLDVAGQKVLGWNVWRDCDNISRRRSAAGGRQNAARDSLHMIASYKYYKTVLYYSQVTIL